MERSAANSDRRRSAGPCRKSARDRRDLAGEVNLYRVAHAARDCLLPRLRSEEIGVVLVRDKAGFEQHRRRVGRSGEHTSELQSLMRISYAVFCLKKKNNR